MDQQPAYLPIGSRVFFDHPMEGPMTLGVVSFDSRMVTSHPQAQPSKYEPKVYIVPLDQAWKEELPTVSFNPNTSPIEPYSQEHSHIPMNDYAHKIITMKLLKQSLKNNSYADGNRISQLIMDIELESINRCLGE